LAVVAGSIQKDRAEKEERVEECRRKRLGGMSLEIVGSDWEECKTLWE
jgi:hypothetical protein